MCVCVCSVCLAVCVCGLCSLVTSHLSYAEKMVEMGYNVTDIKESLAENAYDEICATYMLLGLTPEYQHSLNHPSSSSLSPVNPIDTSLPMTPTGVSSTRGESAGGYKYSPSSNKGHSSGSSGGHTHGHMGNKKISAPGVVQSSVSSFVYTLSQYYCLCHHIFLPLIKQ